MSRPHVVGLGCHDIKHESCMSFATQTLDNIMKHEARQPSAAIHMFGMQAYNTSNMA